jgi:hypothetical protein
MSKNLKKAVILTGLSIVFTSPLIVLGYGFVLGHTYTANQLWAACVLTIPGLIFAFVAAYHWSEL